MLPLPQNQAVRQFLVTPFELEVWLTASATWTVMAHSLLRQHAYTAARVFFCHALARQDCNMTTGAGTANPFEKDTWDGNEDDDPSRYMIVSEDKIEFMYHTGSTIWTQINRARLKYGLKKLWNTFHISNDQVVKIVCISSIINNTQYTSHWSAQDTYH